MSSREIDETLARMDNHDDEDDEGGSIVELAAERYRHPAYGKLRYALERLRDDDPEAYRLLNWTFVARSGLSALVRLHALAYVSRTKPVRESVAGTVVSGLIRLDELLGDVQFPRVVREQEQSWEQWLAAVRPKVWVDGGAKTHTLARAALELRNLYVRELCALGLSQSRAAAHVGLTDRHVRRILVDRTEAVSFTWSPPNTRQALRDQNGALDRRPCDERQAEWESKRLASGASIW